MAPRLLFPNGMDTSLDPILVVDDDPACCESMANALLRAGYHVDATTNALRALARVMNRRYALVIADLQMPQLTGIALLARLRSANRATPGILVSGFPDARAMEEARMLGVAVLSKPFGVDTMLAMVRDALRGQTAIRRTA